MTWPWRRLLVPFLAALPVLAVLLALGTWQVQRMHWKHDILARIAASEAGPPVPLTAAPPGDYAKVAATGRFRHDLESRLWLEVRDAVLGAHLLTPLERPGLPTLLVDRGWVPLERSRPIDRPEGEVQVVGFTLPQDRQGLFSARDDVVGRHFYTLDTAAIATALGLGPVEPFALIALGEIPPGALPVPARTLPRPNDPHLGYVITWYGLAVALVLVFAVFARRRLKGTA
ncbi:SURF1 family protein [Roseomonas sp. OT10]|uniref:SURF1 family protein n=1 Tax=Roseomonas cutis TaxID=2897332 RepID=UPI001E470038|nr:SURF1 family cytochrome oxidase biogenesis protein [Roseomonas sp. OT10]UFN51220.1 SURF1 family protein [Roseomonas sp. OT10]